jgi:hypothetical protein
MKGIPASMCGVQLTGHGGLEKLVWREDIPVPRPMPGEVLVRVLAAGVNMTDLNTRKGWYGGEGRAAGWLGKWRSRASKARISVAGSWRWARGLRGSALVRA